MNTAQRIADWLETHWIVPAYSGWLLTSLSVFFFVAATNTMAGWLYVLSGIGIALLGIAAILPERSLRQLQVHRTPLDPVSSGEQLTVELVLENRSKQPKSLLQVQDVLPYVLGQPVTHAIETIPPQGSYRWVYYQPTQRRGVYRWQTVQLRTAAPLGLFWCRRRRDTKASAIVYPTVLPLMRCPLVDEMGRDTSLQISSDRRSHTATEGLTRSLRPYRWGDPTRLVHWRSSARYNQLRVRELEVFTGGQELVICLDSALSWRRPSEKPAESPAAFEEAVIAAASLYFYACHRSLSVKLWTASTGVIQGSRVVLEALAATQAGEEVRAENLPNAPLIWLTHNPIGLSTLPPGSRWVLWANQQTDWKAAARVALTDRHIPGLVITPERSLEQQLESPLNLL